VHRIAARPEHASRVKDLDITVRDGRLTVKAERSERKESRPVGVFLRLVRPLGSAAGER
jgi:hypothetical protein